MARVTSERLRSAKRSRQGDQRGGPVNPSDDSETQAQVIVYATDLGLSAAAGDPRIEGGGVEIDRLTTTSFRDRLSAIPESGATRVSGLFRRSAWARYGIEQFSRPGRD